MAIRILILRTCESVLEVSSAWKIQCVICECDGLTARSHHQNERSASTISFIIFSHLLLSSLSSSTLTQLVYSRVEVTTLGASICLHNQNFVLICDVFPCPAWLLLNFGLDSFSWARWYTRAVSISLNIPILSVCRCFVYILGLQVIALEENSVPQVPRLTV